jgi:hypothetical protein
MTLIDKYLGESELDEAMGRGHMRPLVTRNAKKLAALLKKKNITFAMVKGQVHVGDDDWDDAEELMARNLLF